jgi:hypothetical protein
MVARDEAGTARSEQVVRDNYARTKARRFPDWPGEPEIVLGQPVAQILGHTLYSASGWYADVPEEYVLPALWEHGHDTPVYDRLLTERWPTMHKHQPGRNYP